MPTNLLSLVANLERDWRLGSIRGMRWQSPRTGQHRAWGLPPQALFAASAARNAELAARGDSTSTSYRSRGGTNPGSPPCNRPRRQYPRG